MTIPITTIANRPTGKPVFDFQLDGGQYCRVPLTTVSNDGMALVVQGAGYQIDSSGNAVTGTDTGTQVHSPVQQNSIALSGILAGTHTLYDGWCKYIPSAGTTISATNLPAGWTSGSGAPSTPTPAPAYGTGYYDTAADQGWVYTQGALAAIAEGYANALQAQIDTAAKLAAIGL